MNPFSRYMIYQNVRLFKIPLRIGFDRVNELSKFDCTYVITESHLLNWVKQMHGKSVKKNASVITKSLINRLNTLNNTKVVIMENRQYEQLTDWLTKISGEDFFEIMYLKQESSP